jgi:hypothetical protein
MKSREFADAMRKLADVLSSVNPGGRHVAGLRTVASVFDLAQESATVAQVVKRLKQTDLALPLGSPSLGDLVDVFESTQTFLKAYGKPAALVTDLNTVKEFFQTRRDASLQALMAQALHIVVPPPPPQLREDVVQRYLPRLEVVASDRAGFTVVLNEIAADPNVGKLEAIALAKRFTGATTTSKKTALNKLRSHHRALATLRAKGETRQGRSAA